MMRGVSAERWRQAGAIFHELVELDASSRSDRLARIGESDPELRAAVEALLAGDAVADDALPTSGFGLGLEPGTVSADALGIAGQTLGRFHVIEQIAWGGMGVVYRADDLQLERTVALKFPLLDDGVTTVAHALSLREARAAGALDHPNLCPIYDIGESARGPYFVMPLYSGETLKERIARVAPLEIGESLAIMDQLAAGLACAHAAGIVHCDIKPGNIMLLPDGTLKLLDFGLARAVSADSPATTEVVGTIAYMAPEQLRNEPIDARADLWALGVILYEMLSGSRPFAGDGPARIVAAVLESEPEPLAARGVAIPDAVQELVTALLAKDPRARVQTATDLTRAITTVRRRIERPLSRRKMLRRVLLFSGVAAGIAVVAIALWPRTPATLIASGKLASQDTIVLADFAVAGLGSSSVPALTSLLRLDFAKSKDVSLMPQSDVNSTLTRMRRPAETPITVPVAREIAVRQGFRAVLSGRVAPRGSGYVLTLSLIESVTGDELASSTANADSAEWELLPALMNAGEALRRKVSAPSRGPQRTTSAKPKPLTTTSAQAARLMWSGPALTAPEKITAARAAVRLDRTFAYAWSSIGNMLDWTGYRSAAFDSTFTMAYRFRENVTPMERAQVSGLYWWKIQRDRRRAVAEMQSALDHDTTMFSPVPLNITEILVESRQFERAEAFARRIERWKTVGSPVVGALVRSQLARGEYAAAESTVNHWRSIRPPEDRSSLPLELTIALSTQRFDSAKILLAKMPKRDIVVRDWAALDRLHGRRAEAHRMDEWLDSAAASTAAAAGARYDPTSGRALTLAREALWLDHDPAAAVAELDKRWRSPAQIYDIQDRIDGIDAARLYAAAGRSAKARTLLTEFDHGADTIAKRAIYEHRQTALAEIALAERRFTEAMARFRASDLAADGLPASPCAVCVLPHLARVAERAGWSDSARVFWKAYVSRPAIERLETDQWFLHAAQSKVAAGRRP